MITLDYRKDSEIDKYLHNFEIMITLYLLGLFTLLVIITFFFLFAEKLRPSHSWKESSPSQKEGWVSREIDRQSKVIKVTLSQKEARGMSK